MAVTSTGQNPCRPKGYTFGYKTTGLPLTSSKTHNALPSYGLTALNIGQVINRRN